MSTVRGWSVRLRSLVVAVVVFVGAIPSFAHVGSPDVYFQGAAGPYHLIVTVRTPQMIPGVASVEVLSATPGITKISVVPTYIVGPGAKDPPEGDVLVQGKDDPQYFAGKVWLMASGSWQVRLKVDGTQGPGELAVPVPAAARATLPMERGLGVLLLALMALLVAAFIAIMGAATREAAVAPGEEVPTRNRTRARIAMGVATAIVLLIVFGGNYWWSSEATATARRMIYAAPTMEVKLGDGGQTMQLDMLDSKWHSGRPETVMTELIPDHGHLMHLFLVREPGMDAFYHLHPRMVTAANPKPIESSDETSDVAIPNAKQRVVTNSFEVTLPSLPAGKYQVYADVVRASGFPDTMTAEIEIPETAGAAMTGDDSGARATAIEDTAAAAANATESADGPAVTLADGYKMVWMRGSAPLVANQFVWLKFRLEDPQGKPVTDGEPYMGMAGHAEIVSADRSVFAHIHPDGSPAMAAVEMANAPATKSSDAAAMPVGMEPTMKMPMDVMTGQPSAEVSFPYGFPKAGRYRIFAQMKRGGQIETGVFDAYVVAAGASK